jgi:hypothetical protein
MNDRIKELIKQSERVDHYTTGDYFPVMTVNGEKLAQLVIEECIRVGSAAELEGKVWWTDAVRTHFRLDK